VGSQALDRRNMREPSLAHSPFDVDPHFTNCADIRNSLGNSRDYDVCYLLRDDALTI
jgi:hypothetical protein